MLEPEEMKRWQRLTAAMLDHAVNDDPEAFAQVVKLLEDATARLPRVAQELTGSDAPAGVAYLTSYSWADIGRALGITRQSAHRRFGRAS